MFAERIKSALEKEVVGQPKAINGVVRGVTRVSSGLTPRERPLCAYLLMGPPGTGKTHVVRTIARILHGDESRLNMADCHWSVHGDPWMSFATQLSPAFAEATEALVTPPLSILLVEGLDVGPRELCPTLGSALKTAQIMLPQGRRGLLRNCLVFLTTSLCSREILDESPRIGFTGSFADENDDDEEEDKLTQFCREEAEKQFGTELLGQLDGMIIFRRLETECLASILDNRFERLGQRLAKQGFGTELRPAAHEFLLKKSIEKLRLGARDLVLAHRKFVEFPIADLLVSGAIPPGGKVVVDRTPDEDRLTFTVTGATSPWREPLEKETIGSRARARRVPVSWGDG